LELALQAFAFFGGCAVYLSATCLAQLPPVVGERRLPISAPFTVWTRDQMPTDT